MSKSDELRAIAALRQAVAPLIPLLKAEADHELSKRLEVIESVVLELAKRDTTIEVKAPDVHVKVDTEALTKSIETLKKSEPVAIEQPTYEPHDQAKSQTFQYSGFVRSDGAWYIQRVAKGEQRYTKGVGDYAGAWEKRSKHKYGYIDG